MKHLLAGLFACLLALCAHAQVGGPVIGQASGISSGGTISGGNDKSVVFVHPAGTIAQDANFTYDTTLGQLALGAGSATNPGYGFNTDAGLGMYRSNTNTIGFAAGGGLQATIGPGSLGLQTGVLSWNGDTFITRDGAANTLAQKNSTNAQTNRLYFSTTGPIYWQATARTAGVLYTGVGGAAQISFTQTTAPTCTANCGTSPSIAGSDTAMRVTMGATGVPASAWVVTFNGTWPAAPVCIAQSALASMVVGKMPIAVVTTTTTITVTTNGTAPATSDQYQIQCEGIS